MLTTFGETLLQLESPVGQRLSTADAYQVYAAGHEAAAAVAARRAGAEATHATVLPDTPLGERAASELRSYDVSLQVDHGEGRQGLVFRQPPVDPAPGQHLRDRTASTLAAVDPESVTPPPVDPDGGCYVTTDTLTRDEATARIAAEFLVRGTESGATTALGLLEVPDDAEAAEEAVRACSPAADILVAAPDAVAAVLDREGEPRQIAHALATEHELEMVAIVRDRTLLTWHDATVFETDVLDVNTVDNTGAADAFTGTFLARVIAGDDVERSLTVATAAHALARTVRGPLASYSRDDLKAVAGSPAE